MVIQDWYLMLVLQDSRHWLVKTSNSFLRQMTSIVSKPFSISYFDLLPRIQAVHICMAPITTCLQVIDHKSIATHTVCSRSKKKVFSKQ